MLFNPPQPTNTQTKFPNGSSITEFPLTPTPTLVLTDRSGVSNRRGFTVYNDSSSNALFSYGTSISATVFTAELVPGGWIEDSPSAPWQGPAVMRSTNNSASVNVTEIVIL